MSDFIFQMHDWNLSLMEEILDGDWEIVECVEFVTEYAEWYCKDGQIPSEFIGRGDITGK